MSYTDEVQGRPFSEVSGKSLWRKSAQQGDREAAKLAVNEFIFIFRTCRPVKIQLILSAGFIALAYVWTWLMWDSVFPMSKLVWFIMIVCLGFMVEVINTTCERVGNAKAADAKSDRIRLEIDRPDLDPEKLRQREQLLEIHWGPLGESSFTFSTPAPILRALDRHYDPFQNEYDKDLERRLQFNKHSRWIKDGGAAVTTAVALAAFTIEPLLIFFQH
ncbi:hypothetical protein HJC99_02105 [Candidatus Saccharibacteria bacterium]|nr:hypothetical protein [Candidatus Saccharibacteria bacterium]